MVRARVGSADLDSVTAAERVAELPRRGREQVGRVAGSLIWVRVRVRVRVNKLEPWLGLGVGVQTLIALPQRSELPNSLAAAVSKSAA